MISVCMIVKNEEHSLPKALENIWDLADEVVVLDTGSEDDTIKVAEKLGCKVYKGGDPLHKGASRNESIEKATGDWVVILDADEKIGRPKELKKHILAISEPSSVTALEHPEKMPISLGTIHYTGTRDPVTRKIPSL